MVAGTSGQASYTYDATTGFISQVTGLQGEQFGMLSSGASDLIRLTMHGSIVDASLSYDLSGFVRDASFVRVREVYLSLAPAVLRGASVRIAAHQLLAWTPFPSGDPEAMPRSGAVASGAAGSVTD